jgi:thiol-disulfide isomerase/thioredoxin
MKFLNRYFFAGVVVGSMLTFAAIVGFSLLVASSMMKRHGPHSYLGRAPEFPASGPIVALRKGEDWSVRGLDGTPMSLREQRGHVVFLNHWATWCGPCVAEMPSIQALYDSLNTEGVVFALVSEEEPAKVRAFVQERSIRVPVYVTETKPPAAYKSVGIPATFILDRDGGIVAEHVGAANWDVERCRRYLRRLVSL